jgi:hypothetical protein
MDQFEFFKSVYELADKAIKSFDDEPKPKDAFWDRLVEVCQLGKWATRADVINYITDLQQSKGYAKLAAQLPLEREVEGLRVQVQNLKSEIGWIMDGHNKHNENFKTDIDEVLGRY